MLTTDQVQAQVEQNRARMARIEELLHKFEPANAMCFENFEGDLSEMLEHARWMHQRLENQRALLRSHALRMQDVHQKLELIHKVHREEMAEVANGLALPSERSP